MSAHDAVTEGGDAEAGDPAAGDAEPGDYEPGQRVRWKQGSRWRYGHLGGDVLAPDGSLRVYDDVTGAARALRAGDVERLVRGPRGGRRWAPYGDPDAVTATAGGASTPPATPPATPAAPPEARRDDEALVGG